MPKAPTDLSKFNPRFSILVEKMAGKAAEEIPPFIFRPEDSKSPRNVAIDFRRSLHTFLRILRETPSHPLHQKAILWSRLKTISAPKEQPDGSWSIIITEAKAYNPSDPIAKALDEAGFSLQTGQIPANPKITSYLSEEGQ